MKPKKSLTWRMAKLLVHHATNVLPPERENWAQAMSNEIDHLPDSNVALSWAIGCMFTCYIERMTNMNIGNLRVSRVTLTFEMLMCFGFLSMFLFASLIRVENMSPVYGSFEALLLLSTLLIGPIGLIFGFRLIVLKRTYMSKAMIAALIIPGAWTLIVNSIVMSILAATPGLNSSWGWGATLMTAILPVLGVAHLIYMSNPEGKMNMAI